MKLQIDKINMLIAHDLLSLSTTLQLYVYKDKLYLQSTTNESIGRIVQKHTKDYESYAVAVNRGIPSEAEELHSQKKIIDKLYIEYKNECYATLDKLLRVSSTTGTLMLLYAWFTLDKECFFLFTDAIDSECDINKHVQRYLFEGETYIDSLDSLTKYEVEHFLLTNLYITTSSTYPTYVEQLRSTLLRELPSNNILEGLRVIYKRLISLSTAREKDRYADVLLLLIFDNCKELSPLIEDIRDCCKAYTVGNASAVRHYIKEITEQEDNLVILIDLLWSYDVICVAH